MSKARNTGNLNNSIQISDTGAITFVSGSTTLMSVSPSGQLSGSAPVLSASFAEIATSSSYAMDSTNAASASMSVSSSYALNATTAATASFANSFTVSGNLIAQTLVVQTITSSVDFVTGSTRFGSTIGNTHQFTGSVAVSGSVSVNGLKFDTGAGSPAGTGNIAIGPSTLTRNTTGYSNIGIGNDALNYNTTGYQNIAVGEGTLRVNSTGLNNVGVGWSALASIISGSNNVGVGFFAGSWPSSGSAGYPELNNGCVYIGSFVKASTGLTVNEIVIGGTADGRGSNTVVIGNNSITDNYFSGNIRGGAFIRSGGTSSQFLKADGSVDGTGYLPLSGGTLTGPLNGTSATFTGLTVNNGNAHLNVYLTTGTSAGWDIKTYLTGGNSGSEQFIYFGYPTAETNAFIQRGSNGRLDLGTSGTVRLSISSTGAATFSQQINGTSLSMSGGGSFGGNVTTGGNTYASFIADGGAANGGGGIIFKRGGVGYGLIGVEGYITGGSESNLAIFAEGGKSIKFMTNGAATAKATLETDGTFLINTTTTEAPYKLIVNGGVKFGTGGTTTITAAGAATFSSDVFGTSFSATSNIGIRKDGSNVIGDGPYYQWTNAAGTRSWVFQLNASNGLDLWHFDGTSWATPKINFTNTGAATFSSLGTGTVYSNGGRLTNTNPSDLNLKTDIAQITYGLNDILKLNPVTFNWKDDKINQGKQYGFIAQEVQEIMPDLVKDGEYLGLDKEAIFTILVKAVQEQQAEINELKRLIVTK